ncbi:hypothetical protein DSM25558_0696 [Agrobacterium sp. DSM 25558]|uniref:hypothetical protein n=1 Tax=Agrobacterium sp. DSM 25558 TaxID=1907665 RepID=UPI000972450E|nr:hypothetical protein [Agrobacterium sp. DSM 25558]SCX04676.1 hypothetical protein DSM25558_0696 [Agrobacterium sp. DSM 25558]
MTRFSHILLASLLTVSVAAPAHSEPRNVDGIWLDDGENLKSAAMPVSGPLVLNGWTRQGRGDVYRLKVKAGETLKVTLTSRSEFVVMAIFDFAKPDDDAIFFSEAGKNTAVLTPKTDTEWLIRPILVLSSSRRGLGANYTVTVERQP